MKHFRFLATVFVATGTLFLGSCNSGKDKKADEKMPDSTATTTETAVTTPSGPTSIMIIRHKVANYAKWKTGYESHDSFRLASGLHNYVIGRGIEDSNTLLVAVKMDDVEKAKAFAASPDLKAKMKEVGVTGVQVIDFLESVMNDTTAIQATARVMIRSKVKDWDAWKKSFEGHKQARMDAGLTDRVISYTVGDNHNVTLVFAVADMDKAKAFMNSQDLKDKMKEAGVDGPPDIFFYKIAKKY
jgi:hypothetical protein